MIFRTRPSSEASPAREPTLGNYPSKLLWCLEGWPPPGPNIFRWENGQLIYRAKGGDKFASPSPARWQQLWRVCEELDVWSWPPAVGDTRVIDGLEYILELEYASRGVKSSGQVVGSPPGFPEKVKALHAAMQELTRG